MYTCEKLQKCNKYIMIYNPTDIQSYVFEEFKEIFRF